MSGCRALVWIGLVACYAAPAPTTKPTPAPPAQPAPIPEEATALHVGAGDGMSCTLDAAGAAWCWGVAHGAPSFLVREPTKIPHLAPATSLAVGDRFACALHADGSVTCWGDGDAGQTKAPAADVMQISAGRAGACALLRGGSITCWGNVPQPPRQIQAARVYAGVGGACAVRRDGSALCWGANAPATTPRGVAEFALSDALSCARLRDASVHCWGYALDRDQPSRVQRIDGIDNALSIDIGLMYACARIPGDRVVCWGTNAPGVRDAPAGTWIEPRQVAVTQPLVELAAGHEHACGRDRDGATWCWGWNTRGESGDFSGGYAKEAIRVELAERVITQATQPPPSTPTPPTITQLASGARRVELRLDSAVTLEHAGWKRLGGGTTESVGGKLVLRGRTEQWITDTFLEDASNPPGWAVEIRLATDGKCKNGSIGLWITDGLHHISLHVGAERVMIESPLTSHPIGPTNVLRTYRLELAGSTITVKVDGTVAFSVPANQNAATAGLMFGKLGGGCLLEESTWEYLAYETYPSRKLAWPPRREFHPNVDSKPLVDILTAKIPSLGKLPAIPNDLAACVGFLALEGAVRELPLAYYRSLKNARAIADLSGMSLLDHNKRFEATMRIFVWQWGGSTPDCDPIPNANCTVPAAQRVKPPPYMVQVQTALSESLAWAAHPRRTERALDKIADVYVEALATKSPGAEQVVKQLGVRLRALKKRPATCGLKP